MPRIKFALKKSSIVLVIIAIFLSTLLFVLAQESGKQKPEEVSTAIALKKQKLRSIIDQIVTGLSQIDPIETRILAYIETAATLWRQDKTRSYQLINQGITLLESLSERKTDNDVTLDLKAIRAEKESRERFVKAVLHKIALLDPTLAIRIEKERSEKKESTEIEYSDVAQKLMDTAVLQARENPAQAAEMARRSLSKNPPYSNVRILFALQAKDKVEAEKLAIDLMKYFEAIPYSSINLAIISQYIFYKDASTERLRNTYFEALSTRIQADLRLGPAPSYVSKIHSGISMSLRLAADYPKSRQQFEKLQFDLNNSFPVQRETSQPSPSKTIDMSDLLAAKEGDTQQIRADAARLSSLSDPRERDNEYARLAASAAQKADQSLAEDLLSKIKDDHTRRIASAGVYGPLVRKSLEEKDWLRARSLSAKVSDSLGRSFILIEIASRMKEVKVEKDPVIHIYSEGLNQLQADPENLNTAKAYLALANPLLSFDSDLALTAIQGAVRSFNNSKLPRPYSNETVLPRSISIWRQSLSPELTDETFDPSAVLPRIFRLLAAKKPNEAESLADQFFDRGLQIFAQLGIIGMELTE